MKQIWEILFYFLVTILGNREEYNQDMEAGFDLEDDLFYADLNKQISLLIMDDDDNDQDSLAQYPSLNLQVLLDYLYMY